MKGLKIYTKQSKTYKTMNTSSADFMFPGIFLLLFAFISIFLGDLIDLITIKKVKSVNLSSLR